MSSYYPQRLMLVIVVALLLGLSNVGTGSTSAAAPSCQGKPTVPPTPRGLRATAVSASAIDVAWASASCAMSYELLVDGTRWITSIVTTTTYRDSPLTAGTAYRYQVRARNSKGVSAYSAAVSATTSAQTPPPPGRVGPKSFYLALGDSIAQGGSPLNDVTAAYAYTVARSLGISLTNYGCSGESSTTFVNGGCPYPGSVKDFYAASQLTAAQNFILAHPGQVSPVSLQVGANDLFAVTGGGCGVSGNATAALDTYESNLRISLGALSAALKDAGGTATGDLVVLNMYHPYQNDCLAYPASRQVFQDLNARLAKVAGEFGVPVVDTFTAFGSQFTTPNNLVCTYTYMCASPKDVHPTKAGHDRMADELRSTLGY